MRTNNALELSVSPPADLPISPYLWLVAAVLSVALVALNHDFDVIGERIDDPSAGGKLDLQAQFEKGIANSDRMRQAGFGLLLATGCLAMFGPKKGAKFQVGGVAILAAASLAWAAASWFWSVDRSETAHELTRLVSFTIVTALLVRRFQLHELMILCLVACLTSIVVACAADIFAGTFQPWDPEFRLGGSLHPNKLARLGAFVALIGYAALSGRRYRATAWLLVATGTVVVVLTYSRSSFAALLAGMAAIHLVSLARGGLTFYASSVLAILAGCMLVLSAVPANIHRQMTQAALMGRTDDASSLAGRVPLWHEMWRDASKRPYAGHGYGAYWTTNRVSELAETINWFPRHSHSAYMELLIDLGFVGLIVVVVLAALSLVQHAQLAAATGRFEYRFFVAVIVAGFVVGFFEVAFITPRFEGMLAGIPVLVLFLRQAEPAVKVVNHAQADSAKTWRTTVAARSSPVF